jgi:hypothetical protein
MKHSLILSSVLALGLGILPHVASAQATDQTATMAPMATATANPMMTATAAPGESTYSETSAPRHGTGWLGLVGLLGLLGLFGMRGGRTTTIT